MVQFICHQLHLTRMKRTCQCQWQQKKLLFDITSTKQLFITCKLTDYKWFQQTIPYLLFLFCLYQTSTNHLSYLYNPENDRFSVCSQAWNVTFPARECRIPKPGMSYSQAGNNLFLNGILIRLNQQLFPDLLSVL